LAASRRASSVGGRLPEPDGESLSWSEIAMNWKWTTMLAGALAATLCASAGRTAQDAREASAPSPEALRRMTPGPMHAKLEPLIGSWTMSGKFRMTPGDPWQEFEAQVEREWILDKRFVQEKVESHFLGQPFEGIGLIGYDNVREEFTMVWVESMATGTWLSRGRLEGGKLVFEGENSDAWTGEENRWGKSELDLSGTVHSYRGLCMDAAGKEFVSMEMTAKRRS
jgi:hypothetical protein